MRFIEQKLGSGETELKACYFNVFCDKQLEKTGQNKTTLQQISVQTRNICHVSFLESVLNHSSSSQHFSGPPSEKPWMLTAVGRTVINRSNCSYSHISLPTFLKELLL